MSFYNAPRGILQISNSSIFPIDNYKLQPIM
jgi:hypothetical protein